MDVEVRAGIVTSLELRVVDDFTLAKDALATFYTAWNNFEYAGGVYPLTNNPIKIRNIDVFYCGVGNYRITNTPEESQLRLDGPVAAGTYLGIVAGIGLIAKDNATIRKKLLDRFAYTYIENKET